MPSNGCRYFDGMRVTRFGMRDRGDYHGGRAILDGRDEYNGAWPILASAIFSSTLLVMPKI